MARFHKFQLVIPLTILFVGHWTGDFLFQSSKMALNKAHSLKWLGIHVATYTALFSASSMIALPLLLGLKFGIVNGLIHGVIDFFTSKVVAKYQKRPRIFFPLIGFDQLLHLLTILWTYESRLLFA